MTNTTNTMKLNELKIAAAAILEIPDSVGDFTNESFQCCSGGSPKNKVSIPEVHRCDTPKYRTVSNGWAFSGELVILCKRTGVSDRNNREIFITPNNTTFVFRYLSGDQYSFDFGSIESPSL